MQQSTQIEYSSWGKEQFCDVTCQSHFSRPSRYYISESFSHWAVVNDFTETQKTSCLTDLQLPSFDGIFFS